LKCLEDAQAEDDLILQAICQANLTNYDRALTLLEQACATDGEVLVDGILAAECFDSIHAEPRFIKILKKLGLQK